jgi:N-acetyl-beta-hexosaminidase
MTALSLAGVNTLLLYMEDTYAVPDNPFFGHLRGRYSFAELKEIAKHAADLGVEVIPAIQVLGHLEQVLHWPGDNQ